MNNLALEGKPEDMVITSHICRGNYHSTFFTSGPYDSVADYVFAKENVDALFLEYDDARSGGFAPLAKVSPDKKVVLGLITTKTPQLEEKEVVIKRIHEAAKYIPLDRLYLSPQCGFASCEIGNKLTEEEQWAKLKLVKEIAEEVWGGVIRVELLLIQNVNGNSILCTILLQHSSGYFFIFSMNNEEKRKTKLDRGKFRKLFSIDIYAIVVLKILDAHIRRKIFTS